MWLVGDFEMSLRSVSTAVSQGLGILRKSWLVFHDRLLMGDAFGVWSCPFFGVLFCNVVLGCRYIN